MSPFSLSTTTPTSLGWAVLWWTFQENSPDFHHLILNLLCWPQCNQMICLHLTLMCLFVYVSWCKCYIHSSPIVHSPNISWHLDKIAEIGSRKKYKEFCVWYSSTCLYTLRIFCLQPTCKCWAFRVWNTVGYCSVVLKVNLAWVPAWLVCALKYYTILYQFKILDIY
jgi:hypothetical protein